MGKRYAFPGGNGTRGHNGSSGASHGPHWATQTIPISIISNSRLISEGLPVLLSQHLNLRLIGRYHSELLANDRTLPNPQHHIVLVDCGIGHPATTGWTAYWRALDPPAAVLLLELCDDSERIIACIEAGANGYVNKGASAEEIVQAITFIREGKAVCSPEVTACLFARVATMARQIQSSKAPLTERELEVLHYVAQGYTNQEIADELVLTLRTVKHHVHNILRKLKLTRRYDAAQLALERGWVDEPETLWTTRSLS